MKYIASCSFGKDSLAMLIKIKELNLPLDEVIYCEMRYDENISAEMPLMEEFIPKAEEILKQRYGIEVKHIKGITYKEQFFKIKEKGNRMGHNYGFPYAIGAWCNDRLKIRPIKTYINSINDKVIQYVGIAYDEPKRYERLNHKTHVAPLYDLKITEKEAMEICRQNDLLSPIYDNSFRGGCWFCPKQSLSQLKYLHKNYPHLWDILRELQKNSLNTFKPSYSIEGLEKKFNVKEVVK